MRVSSYIGDDHRLLTDEDFQQDSAGNILAPEPAKYVKITLRTASDGSYFVSALQNTDKPD